MEGTRARAVMDERQDIVFKVRLTCFYYSVTFTTSGRACEGQGRKSCFPFLRSTKIKQTAERKKVTFVPDTDFSAENELSTAENQARKSTTAETRTELWTTKSFRARSTPDSLVRVSSRYKAHRKTSTTITTTGERVELGNLVQDDPAECEDTRTKRNEDSDKYFSFRPTRSAPPPAGNTSPH
jgi:hypothetical protein